MRNICIPYVFLDRVATRRGQLGYSSTFFLPRTQTKNANRSASGNHIQVIPPPVSGMSPNNPAESIVAIRNGQMGADASNNNGHTALCRYRVKNTVAVTLHASIATGTAAIITSKTGRSCWVGIPHKRDTVSQLASSRNAFTKYSTTMTTLIPQSPYITYPPLDSVTRDRMHFACFHASHKSISNRLGSSSASFTRTRNVTAPLPSTIR